MLEMLLSTRVWALGQWQGKFKPLGLISIPEKKENEDGEEDRDDKKEVEERKREERWEGFEKILYTTKESCDLTLELQHFVDCTSEHSPPKR